MTTTLLDIPFECLPIQTLGQLGTLNRESEERARKEFLTRDVGQELLAYLQILPKNLRTYKVEYELSEGQLWSIMEAAASPNEYLILPCHHYGGLRIDVCLMKYHENMSYMMHVHSTLHMVSIVPHVLRQANAISSNIEEAIDKMTRRIHDMIWSMVVPYTPQEYMDIEWFTSPIAFHWVDCILKRMYVTPAFTFRWDSRNGLQTEAPTRLDLDANAIKPIVNTILDATARVL